MMPRLADTDIHTNMDIRIRDKVLPFLKFRTDMDMYLGA